VPRWAPRARQALLDLYRPRWDVAELAVDLSRFRRPHAGTEDDETSWDILTSLLARISR
jgi:spectinomycin phosphotransferase/16S rRNA (guanine(1405)-N(7))-methyltransferase